MKKIRYRIVLLQGVELSENKLRRSNTIETVVGEAAGVNFLSTVGNFTSLNFISFALTFSIVSKALSGSLVLTHDFTE